MPVRAFVITATVALLAIVVAAGWAYSVARAALPQQDGAISIAGLRAPVKVTRDSLGMPHIAASNLEDLHFAQGYVTAQDRLWQMDLTRRFAAGELSEILGKATVKRDRRQRILGLRQVAERAAAALDAEDRTYLEAYARGVNAYIQQTRDHLPLEFRVLRYEPRPWTVADSLLVGVSLADGLSLDLYRDQVAREKVVAKLGPTLAADLYPATSWRDHPPGQDKRDAGEPTGGPGEEQSPMPLAGDRSVTAVTRQALDLLDMPVPGSNNWAVSGAHTQSGKPLLANDMHLSHSLPNVWYMVDLRAGDFHVAGVSAPGLPLVTVGHNEHIAWGITNMGPEAQDTFVETFNASGEYQTPQGWATAQHRREVIRVKGQDDVVLDVESTRHGPIISELLPGEQRKIALRWTLYDGAGMKFPFRRLALARNWNEFREAWRDFVAPALNLVYADDAGHIGYQAVGVIPIRKASTEFMPVSGADDAHEWTGPIPFDELPRVFDPPSGVVASANARIAPDAYPYPITSNWSPPYRVERIYRRLQGPRKLTAADMLAIQTDVYSDFDHFMAQRIVYAVDHSGNASKRAREAAEVLRTWDGNVVAESAAPSITAAARRQLWKLLLEPKLGAEAVRAPEEIAASGGNPLQYRWLMANVALERLLLRQPADWLPNGYPDYNALLTAALENALKSPGAPSQPADWKWGKVSTIAAQHSLFGNIPLLSWWTGTRRMPQSGNGNTVKQVGATFGPSQRMTVDFGSLDGSSLNIVNGESGHFLSPHYNDQWEAWYAGTTFAWPWSEGAVAAARRHELTLIPAR